MIYRHDFSGSSKAVLPDAYVFEAVNLDEEKVLFSNASLRHN
jgi:hypothetical protein